MRGTLLVLTTVAVIIGGVAVASGQSPTTTGPTTTPRSPSTSGAPEVRSPSSSPPLGDCLPASSGAKARAAGEPIEPITIQASPQAQTVDFGGGRDSKKVVIKLSAAAPVPDDVVNRLELVADPILRVGDTTVAENFPEPTFSAFRVSRNRKTISFKVCLNPEPDLPAGKYVATINLEGPPGVESATITVTANAKDETLFLVATGISLLLATLLLWFRAAADERDRRIAEAEEMPSGSAEEKRARKTAITDAKKWRPALGTPGNDLAWWVGSLAAVGGAAVAVWGIYTANASWGDAGAVTSGVAVIGAGLAAVGAKTLITKAK